jgi:hypothetical protein
MQQIKKYKQLNNKKEIETRKKKRNRYMKKVKNRNKEIETREQKVK